eukprot:COSAG03_NODE_623_length_6665_cov_3.515230_6_plen_51_part_00
MGRAGTGGSAMACLVRLWSTAVGFGLGAMPSPTFLVSLDLKRVLPHSLGR